NCSGETSTPAGMVARLYQVGIGIAGFLAFGAIILGALRLILSADNLADQKDAKDQMGQAIYGLLLLLGAYLILKTINPDLVNLKNPNAEPVTVDSVEGSETNTGVTGRQSLPQQN
ncbi:MAG: hypothetical protein PHN74_03500, partial [Candidatus Pacebacteria bacterium]|nr:hypothetical protein [Candidatus Paceibacterota bacterium]